jgi:acetyltransferase-like isoleucine patch superfamily enzyme
MAKGTLVAMGACVTKNTEEWGVYTGVPAKKGEALSRDMDI